MTHADEHPGWEKAERFFTFPKLIVTAILGVSTVFMAGIGFIGLVNRNVVAPEVLQQFERTMMDSLRSHGGARGAIKTDVDSLRFAVRTAADQNREVLRKLDYLICRDEGDTIEECSVRMRGF